MKSGFLVLFQPSLSEFPGGSDGKESAWNAGDPDSIPGQKDPQEKRMATHSSILAWRIPWTEEPGRLQSRRSQSWTGLTAYHFHFHVIVYWAQEAPQWGPRFCGAELNGRPEELWNETPMGLNC